MTGRLTQGYSTMARRIPMNPVLHKKLKVFCAQTGVTMQKFAEDAIAKRIEVTRREASTPGVLKA